MEEPRLVYRFQRNPDEEIRILLKEYKERYYLDLRLWFHPSSGGEYFPTKKGISVALGLLPELKKGVDRAVKLAAELPLQKQANSVE